MMAASSRMTRNQGILNNGPFFFFFGADVPSSSTKSSLVNFLPLPDSYFRSADHVGMREGELTKRSWPSLTRMLYVVNTQSKA